MAPPLLHKVSLGCMRNDVQNSIPGPQQNEKEWPKTCKKSPKRPFFTYCWGPVQSLDPLLPPTPSRGIVLRVEALGFMVPMHADRPQTREKPSKRGIAGSDTGNGSQFGMSTVEGMPESLSRCTLKRAMDIALCATRCESRPFNLKGLGFGGKDASHA